MTGAIKKTGVIGFPVSHSLSPRLHNYWLKKHAVSATYAAIEIRPETLEAFLHAMAEKGFAGVNLTIPHKETSLRFLHNIDDIANRIGAVNTVVVKDGKLLGTNTDAYGFMENLKNCRSQVAGCKALVIGAGGAARAVCIGLLDAGYEITLTNRTPERAEMLASALKDRKIKTVEWDKMGKVIEDASLLVNTTSLGMKGQPFLDINLDTLPQSAVVTDIVYNPLKTRLLEQAEARGNGTVDGLGMLLYQAQLAFYEWFGIKPEVTDELRQHVIAGFT